MPFVKLKKQSTCARLLGWPGVFHKTMCLRPNSAVNWRSQITINQPYTTVNKFVNNLCAKLKSGRYSAIQRVQTWLSLFFPLKLTFTFKFKFLFQELGVQVKENRNYSHTTGVPNQIDLLSSKESAPQSRDINHFQFDASRCQVLTAAGTSFRKLC